jgi:Ca-activated chloride channel family protein
MGTSLLLVGFGLGHSALASTSEALRDYKQGKYSDALKQYEQLLEKKTDDPRLHFNAGASAYRDRQFDEAAKQFDQALSTPDLTLQQSAYYNRGNTLYYLGENAPDPTKRSEAWEKALKDYELSMKLNTNDFDAKFNHELVKKRLEELKQQQQQNQQNQQNKSDQNKQDQQQQQNQKQNQQDQQSKQDQNQQQQQQQQQQQAKQDQKQNSSQQDQQKQQEQQQQQAQQQKQKQDEQKQQQASRSKEKKDKEKQAPQAEAAEQKDKSDQKDQEGEAYAAGQMTPEQARQLLDAQKGEERMLPVKPENKPTDRNRPFKDW